MKETVESKGLKCEIIQNEKGLPEFKVIDYSDPENVIFKYEKGDIIKPDVTNKEYSELLMSMEGEDMVKWKSYFITTAVVYEIIRQLDNMSYNTLKEVREGLNKKLNGVIEQ